MSSGSPPTLWWLLITDAVPSVPPLSITSGYSVPCTRNSASVSPPVCSSKHADELLADRLALRLRLGDAGQRVEEPVPRVDVDQLDAQVAPERLDHLIALALAHQPGVDVDARELVADRPVHQRRGHGGVDAAGQPADHPAVAHLRADQLDLLLDDRRHLPVGASPRRRAGTAPAPPSRTACAPPRGGTARRRSARSAFSSTATGAPGVLAVT